MTRARPWVIGIIGAIGSGKSSVARQLESLGAERIDADEICHELLTRPELIGEVKQVWGAAVLDAEGQVDRGALAKRVFADAEQLKKLGTILHPRVRQVILERMDQVEREQPGGRIAMEVALLVESGMQAICDTVLFVACDRSQRQARVVEEREWTTDELDRREAHQAGEETKRAAADFIIDNSGTVEQTYHQLTQIWRDLPR